MLEITPAILKNLLAPLAAAQTFLIVLIYFTIVRKRIATDYKLYVCFLVTFIIYLVGRPLQLNSEHTLRHLIMYTRTILLFGVGMPSLLIAMVRHSGLHVSKKQSTGIFIFAALISAVYFITADAGMGQLLFKKELLETIGLPPTAKPSRLPRAAGAICMLILPTLYLLGIRHRLQRTPALSAFLTATLLFGFLLTTGPYFRRAWTVYMGSIFCALCWGWAVFRDIRDLTGNAALVKDQLQSLVQSREQISEPQIDHLLNQLEHFSKGDLTVYKLRIREVISRLTDATIEAGGDTKTLIDRHTQKQQAVDASADTATLREIARSEAVELSAIITDIPATQTQKKIQRAETFISTNYARDLGVEEIAQTVGLSRTHFMREFKKHTGKTVNQYLTAIRMEQAKRLLNKKSVTETAFAIGYNDSNYFGTVFKKQVGMTPSQYKAQPVEPALSQAAPAPHS